METSAGSSVRKVFEDERAARVVLSLAPPAEEEGAWAAGERMEGHPIVQEIRIMHICGKHP